MPHFNDFNFVADLDQRFKQGPDQIRLIQLVVDGRDGRKQSLFEFAEVMYYSLREEAFEELRNAWRLLRPIPALSPLLEESCQPWSISSRYA